MLPLLTTLYLIFRPLPQLDIIEAAKYCMVSACIRVQDMVIYIYRYQCEFEEDMGGSCNLRCERPKTNTMTDP